jgi:hypothetical protein
MPTSLGVGTKEFLPVNVRDVTGTITTLDGTTPTYDVYVVNVDDTTGTAKVTAASCTNSGMTLLPLIDSTTGGGWAAGKYRLYVKFTTGDGQIPRLGPFDFYLR